MSIHQLPRLEDLPRQFVYAILCEDVAGLGYIKFGVTQNIGKRLPQIKNGCPVPIKYVAVIEVGRSRDKALFIESSLHNRFHERKSSGEWFRFDFRSKEDKRDFNDGCKRVFAAFFEEKECQWWTKISVAQLDKYSKDQQRKFLKSKYRRRIQSRIDFSKRQKEAWKELSR